jgi:HSP20 family protein
MEMTVVKRRYRFADQPAPERGGSLWAPPVDVYETGDSYVLEAEIPGVDRRDIAVETSGSDVTIRGERRLQESCLEESYNRLEGRRGRFRRSFSLPDPIDRGRIVSQLKDGVFRVVLPKLPVTGSGRRSED